MPCTQTLQHYAMVAREPFDFNPAQLQLLNTEWELSKDSFQRARPKMGACRKLLARLLAVGWEPEKEDVYKYYEQKYRTEIGINLPQPSLRKTEQQSDLLWAAFNVSPFPDTGTFILLMHYTMLSRMQVYEWFRFQRLRALERGEVLGDGSGYGLGQENEDENAISNEQEDKGKKKKKRISRPGCKMWKRYEELGEEYVRMLRDGEVDSRTGESLIVPVEEERLEEGFEGNLGFDGNLTFGRDPSFGNLGFGENLGCHKNGKPRKRRGRTMRETLASRDEDTEAYNKQLEVAGQADRKSSGITVRKVVRGVLTPTKRNDEAWNEQLRVPGPLENDYGIGFVCPSAAGQQFDQNLSAPFEHAGYTGHAGYAQAPVFSSGSRDTVSLDQSMKYDNASHWNDPVKSEHSAGSDNHISLNSLDHAVQPVEASTPDCAATSDQSFNPQLSFLATTSHDNHLSPTKETPHSTPYSDLYLSSHSLTPYPATTHSCTPADPASQALSKTTIHQIQSHLSSQTKPRKPRRTKAQLEAAALAGNPYITRKRPKRDQLKEPLRGSHFHHITDEVEGCWERDNNAPRKEKNNVERLKFDEEGFGNVYSQAGQEQGQVLAEKQKAWFVPEPIFELEEGEYSGRLRSVGDDDNGVGGFVVSNTERG